MLLLHGIYGACRNWGSVARRLVRARPDWSVVLVDLRSHGRSPRLSPHTLDACADDLLRLEARLVLPADAVLGHSFGGKVALVYARARVEGSGRGAGVPHRASEPGRLAKSPRREAYKCRQLWIVDSSPGSGDPAGSAMADARGSQAPPGPLREPRRGGRHSRVRGLFAPGGEMDGHQRRAGGLRLGVVPGPGRDGRLPPRLLPHRRVGRGREPPCRDGDPLRPSAGFERAGRRRTRAHPRSGTRHRPGVPARGRGRALGQHGEPARPARAAGRRAPSHAARQPPVADTSPGVRGGHPRPNAKAPAPMLARGPVR